MKAIHTMMNFLNFDNLFRYVDMIENDSLHLNEFRKNLTAKVDRSPLMRSYGYASAGDQSTLFAIFPLNFVPFTQYTG